MFDDRASFEGNGYIALDSELMPHTSSAKDEVITFAFTTTSTDGLLLFHGQKPESDGKGQDYLAAAVVDGYLEFRWDILIPIKIYIYIRWHIGFSGCIYPNLHADKSWLQPNY